MDSNRVMRRVLMTGAAFNFFAALVVLFPDSIGAFSGLPRAGAQLFPRMVALFIALFGGVYGWLALRPVIDRNFIRLGAIGKLAAFAVALLCWVEGDIPAQTFAPAIGDLLFGLIFLWWLRTS